MNMQTEKPSNATSSLLLLIALVAAAGLGIAITAALSSAALYEPLTTYAFSPNGDTLSISADLDLDTVNIRELKAPSIAEKVTTLVVKGTHIDDNRLSDLREKGGWERLLPNLHSLSLPDFNGTISFECFLETEWLQHFSSPRATAAERGAFSNCYLLTTANLPEATAIGPEAFRGCEYLIAAYFPIATTIGENAFDGCAGLHLVYLPKAEMIGDGAFADCSELTTVNLPEATWIGDHAFHRCDKLTVVCLPKASTIRYGLLQCPSLVTLKLNAPGEIEFTAPLLGEDAGGSEKINLYLGAYSLPKPDFATNTWNGYKWKSIFSYDNK